MNLGDLVTAEFTVQVNKQKWVLCRNENSKWFNFCKLVAKNDNPLMVMVMSIG